MHSSQHHRQTHGMRVLLMIVIISGAVSSTIAQTELADVIAGFSLINAETGQILTPLNDDAVIDLATLPTDKLAVQLDVSTASVRFIELALNGATERDLVAPWGQPLSGVGTYELTATPHIHTHIPFINNDDYGYDPARASQTFPPPDAIRIEVGQDIQSVVEQADAGSAFVIASGVHRLQSIVPKNNQKFYGEPGAILNGSRIITEFEREGDFWIIPNQTQESSQAGTCGSLVPRCIFEHDVFFDGHLLIHANDLSEMQPGYFYFDYDNDKIYLWDDPRDYLVEVSETDAAFSGAAVGVLISNLQIEKYANRAQLGAIHGDDSLDWTIQHNTIQLNHATGLRLGNGMYVLNNKFDRNGQLGVGGLGDDIILEYNDITNNNIIGYSSGWEAGGTKFVRTDNLLIQRNYVYGNQGHGLWTDIDNSGARVQLNLVDSNRNTGIFHEISNGATFNYNISMNNSTYRTIWLYGAQILISTSPDSTIFGNTVVVNELGGNGIGIIQQDRGDEWRSANNFIRDNKVLFMGAGVSGQSGLVADYNVDDFYTNGNNVFEENTYIAADDTTPYWRGVDSYTFPEFQALGQDFNSTITYTQDLSQQALAESIRFTIVDSENPSAGDCNVDFSIDEQDLSALQSVIFETGGEAAVEASTGGCDVNKDERIDAGDLACLRVVLSNELASCIGD